MLERLDGRSLATFLAVYEERSFSRAAVRLGYVQSTVTAQIKGLEHACGKQLFVRDVRGTVPTPAGEQFAAYAYQFSRLSQSLEQTFSDLDQPKGHVRIRALESFCMTRMLPVLERFFVEYPQVAVSLETGFMPDVMDDLKSNRIDFGLVSQNPERSDVEFIPLVKEEMVLVAGSSYDVWQQPIVKLITFGPRCVYTEYAEEAVASIGMPPEVMEFSSLDMIKHALQLGLGVALLPKICVAPLLKNGVLKLVSAPAPSELRKPWSVPLILEHGIVTLKSRVLHKAASVLCDELLTLRN